FVFYLCKIKALGNRTEEESTMECRMKLRLISSLSFVVLSFSSFANHLEVVCQATVEGDRTNAPVFSEHCLARRLGQDFVVENFQGDLGWTTTKRIHAIAEADQRLWLLRDLTLTELSRGGESVEEFPLAFNPTGQGPKA